MNAPTCRKHEDKRARHAVRVPGEPGLTQVCCKCAKQADRMCTHKKQKKAAAKLAKKRSKHGLDTVSKGQFICDCGDRFPSLADFTEHMS